MSNLYRREGKKKKARKWPKKPKKMRGLDQSPGCVYDRIESQVGRSKARSPYSAVFNVMRLDVVIDIQERKAAE